jgi:hypothetical protein
VTPTRSNTNTTSWRGWYFDNTKLTHMFDSKVLVCVILLQTNTNTCIQTRPSIYGSDFVWLRAEGPTTCDFVWAKRGP